MRLNVFRNQDVNGFAATIRIAYEDNARQGTEEYWRGVCAAEIKSLYEGKNLKIDTLAAYINAENKVRYRP